MAELMKIINFLDKRLDIKNMEDASNNGLQVGENKQVKKIAFAVDANLKSFKAAKKEGCDALIVHHGVSWNDSLKRLTGLNFKRINYLMKNDLALAAYHLPLDKDDKIGHNISLSKMLKLNDLKPFSVGYYGTLPKKVSTKKIAEFLNKKLDTKCTVYEYGNKLNSKISVISGGAARFIESASQFSDCYITGEDKYGTKEIAKEMNMNFIVAGHYETETLGMKNLMPIIAKKFKVKCVFVKSK
ncbi:Nif3-like dinuclear metal center hexameric protein [Candidatus Woesearchaeota archaeon]|nr:Nif3-like dinuclear metal center hexameric protein [Candidatus Woesearchaeota archaeon]